jgi:hypothetical protein
MQAGPDGALRRAFATGREKYPLGAGGRNSCAACVVPALAAAREPRTFWSMDRQDYRLRRWSMSGTAVHDVTVKSPRYPRFFDDLRGNRFAERLRPVLKELAVDARGQIITTGEVAATAWKPFPDGPNGPVRSRGADASSIAAVNAWNAANLATLMQIIDPVRGRVLAERQFDGQSISLLANGHAYSARSDHDGVTHVDVWTVNIRR